MQAEQTRPHGILQQVVSKGQAMWDGGHLEYVGMVRDAHKLLFQQSAKVQVLHFVFLDLFWLFRQIYFMKVGNTAPSLIVTPTYFQCQKDSVFQGRNAS